MTVFESLEYFKWLPIIFIIIFIIIIFTLSYWYFTYQRRNKKPLIKKISSSKLILPKKSLSINSSQLTNTDINYLDKLVRSASDRSMWKKDEKFLSKKNEFNPIRKVPSRQKN